MLFCNIRKIYEVRELLQDSGRNILANEYFYHFILIHALSTDFPTPPLQSISSVITYSDFPPPQKKNPADIMLEPSLMT